MGDIIVVFWSTLTNGWLIIPEVVTSGVITSEVD